MSTSANTENVIPRRRASDWAKPATEDNTLIEHPDGSVTLSGDRQLVCLHAAWELEALANLLPQAVPEHVPAHLVVRGLADRIRRLSAVVSIGLSDTLERVEDLEHTVFGSAQREAA